MAGSNLETPPEHLSKKHDDLLSMPNGTTAGQKLQRADSQYVSKDQRFKVVKRFYERQFAQLYFARLMQLGPHVMQQVKRRWPNTEVVKILDVPEGREVAVLGTIYKHMKLKPSILDEYTKDRSTKAALGASSFCSDDDTLVLEDEGARMALRGEVDVQRLVTGAVMAVKGVAEPGGDFTVSDCCWCEMAPQPPRPLIPEDKYVAMVSGLYLGDARTDVLQVQLLVDYLTGDLGSGDEQGLAAKIVRVVVAGGTVGALEQIAAAQPYSRQQAQSLEPIRDMDIFLTEIASSVPLDIMPGADDPTNCSLPQQPLHHCLFPGAAALSTFQRCTNPHDFEVEGVSFTGTSGQNVDDVDKYSRMGDRLAIMESLLRWRHLAPTAPDTLTCYPFHDNDPYILRQSPHVIFAGNQPEFKTELLKGAEGQEVRVVCLPKFFKTGQLVLVNLRTLQCHPINFETKMDTS